MRYTDQLNVTIHGKSLAIAYSKTLGSPDQTPLLYLPGWGCTKADIEGAEMDPNFADRSIVSYDYPGYGDSPPPPGSVYKLNQWSYLNIAVAVSRRLRLNRPAIVGHSAGGADAIYLASHYPEFVSGLVSVMGNMELSDCFLTKKVANMSDGVLLSGGFKEYLQPLSQSDNPGMQRYARQVQRFSADQVLNYRDHAQSVVLQCDTGNLRQRFLDLACPKLFVHGEDERAAYLDDLHARQVPIVAIEGADHFPFVDKPAEYFKVLGDFMLQLDRDKES